MLPNKTFGTTLFEQLSSVASSPARHTELPSAFDSRATQDRARTWTGDGLSVLDDVHLAVRVGESEKLAGQRRDRVVVHVHTREVRHLRRRYS